MDGDVWMWMWTVDLDCGMWPNTSGDGATSGKRAGHGKKREKRKEKKTEKRAEKEKKKTTLDDDDDDVGKWPGLAAKLDRDGSLPEGIRRLCVRPGSR